MDIFEAFKTNADPAKAQEMAAYLKNQFDFLGIPKPQRYALAKPFLKEKKKEKSIDWPFIFTCYEMPQREFTYLALEYLHAMKDFLVTDDMQKIETLITTHSWWDSVDSFTGIVSRLYSTFPESAAFIHRWIDSENIWLRRISIIFQLLSKEKTDTQLLAKAIEHNLNSREFFINKAIGWALRQYAKTNRAWVEGFIAAHTLSPLSQKEATKHFSSDK